MRVMILAAGLGTRLQPLTNVRPKVLAPIMGMRILDFWTQRLKSSGAEAVVLNAFHLSEVLVKAVREGDWPMEVHVRVEPVLLDTGGGIRSVLDFFVPEPFIVLNGDIICDASLPELYRKHTESGSQVSLLLHDIPAFNNVAVAEDGAILGFGEKARRLAASSPGTRLRAFTGIHVVNPDALRDIPQDTPSSIITRYAQLIEEGAPPKALFQDDLFWREAGSVDAYMRLHGELAQMGAEAVSPLISGQRILVHPEATVASGVTMEGFVVVGAGCCLCESVHLENTVLWDNVRLDPGTELRGCVVADGLRLCGAHQDSAIARSQLV